MTRLVFLPGLALLAVVPSAAMAATPAALPYVAGGDSESFERSLECLSQAIYYEARSQSDDGQRAVAQVVLNRVRHPAFPSSVCGVVFQGSERVTGCQFSFTCDGSMNRGIEPYAWERARRIAAAALRGSVYRPVGLAVNYHTTAINPYWAPSLTPQTVVGDHIFYRRPGSSTLDAFSQSPSDYEPDIAMPPVRYSSPRATVRRARDPYAPIEVVEIPVVERAVVFRTVGGRRRSSSPSSSGSTGTSRPRVQQAAVRSTPRVVVQNGVRIFRGH
ncbi:MAG TPA: cell wall hydrolase [Allosphingosinicella sp.]